MKHSQWMPILLAAGLAWNAAQRAAGETIEYSGDPDHPFPGAWNPDIVCEKGENTPETECWKCEGESPSVEVPKYEWILTRECPTFSMSNTVQSNCYCVLVGGELSDNITADCVAEDGRKYYEPSIEGCGGEPPEEETITQTIEWNWTTSGLTTVPASGQGQTASFKYTVPKGPFAIDVSFSAIAIPSDTNCAEIATGPEVVGQITGAGYEKYQPPEQEKKNPTPQMVAWPLYSDGKKVWGKIQYRIKNCLTTAPVCEGTDCSLCRTEGYFYLIDVGILVVTNMVVTGNNCDLDAGSSRSRTETRITETIDHEQLHLVQLERFVAEWNAKISDLSLADSCDFADELLEEFKDEFKAAYDLFKQSPHCPEFDGAATFAFDGCNEVHSGNINCN
ncbi:MAG: hypothetical protein GX548_03735 [Lentisphaerae bacterium]|nr:hypothetical protein [Lentisphaerota bacterium]